MPLRTFRQIFPDHVTNSGLPAPDIAQAAHQTHLTAYNGTDIACHGVIYVDCQFKDSASENTKFYIVDVAGPAIIGLPSCESLRIVTVHCSLNSAQPAEATPASKSTPMNTAKDLVSKYPQQFDRIGCLPGEVDLVLDPAVPTHIDPPRKTPIALKGPIKRELDKMEQCGVIRKVTEPTD